MIYFVRHGQSDFNLYNVTQGQLNTSLNVTGLNQASELAEKLKDYDFDIIYSSPLNRARQTATIINKHHNLQIIFDDRIMEASRGKLEGTKNSHEIYQDFFANPHKFGGEDKKDVYNRAESFYNEISKIKDKNILIVSHGNFFNYLKFCFDKKDINKDEVVRVNINNCDIFKLED